MSWPTPQDYNEAVQSPPLAFADSDLRAGQAELTPLGLPRPISGNFACVYKIQSGNDRWAARCFIKEVPDLQFRYKAISEYLATTSLPYIVPFTYDPAGIKVQGRNFPLLKMRWIQGESLSTFVAKVLSFPETLLSTAKCWAEMMADLKRANIAHGDLQHGNILVVGNQLQLIDYDGMYVPALDGRQSNELGQPNYQLPSRSEWDYGPYLDNFSSWVIYVSLVALAVHPELWNAYRGGDECLIFRKNDFLNPAGSSILRDLSSSPNADLRFLTEWFTSFFFLSPRHVPSLDGKLTEIKIEAPKPWWGDHVQPLEQKGSAAQKPEPSENIEETLIPDPIWIIEEITSGKPVELVKFQSNPAELRIITSGSIGLVLVITILSGIPISEVLFTTCSVFGLNLLLCFIRYRRDGSHKDFEVFKREAKNFIHQLSEHQTLMDSLSAEQASLREQHAKVEIESNKRRGRVSTDLQNELAKVQAELNSRLQSVNLRRKTAKEDEANKLNSLQGTLGNQILALDRKISDLNRTEADEKQRITRDLQESFIQDRLRRRFIAHSSIPGIGPAYKNRLIAAGFVTAADLDWRVGRVNGIGPTRLAAIKAWRSILETEAQQSAPTLTFNQRQSIEDKYRIERQTNEAAKLHLQNDLNAKITDARRYFDSIVRSSSEEERQIRAASEYDKRGVQEKYSEEFAAIDAELNQSKIRVAPAIEELSEKWRKANQQKHVLHWKSEMHKKEGRRFASLRFRDYLHKIVSL